MFFEIIYLRKLDFTIIICCTMLVYILRINFIMSDVIIQKFIHDVIVFHWFCFDPWRGNWFFWNFKSFSTGIAMWTRVVAMQCAATPTVLMPRRVVVSHLMAQLLVIDAGCYGGENKGAGEQPLLSALHDEGTTPLIERKLKLGAGDLAEGQYWAEVFQAESYLRVNSHLQCSFQFIFVLFV